MESEVTYGTKVVQKIIKLTYEKELDKSILKLLSGYLFADWVSLHSIKVTSSKRSGIEKFSPQQLER